MRVIILVLFSLLALLDCVSRSPDTHRTYTIPIKIIPGLGYHIDMVINQQGPFLCEIDTGSDNLMVPGDTNTCPSCHAALGISPTNNHGNSFRVSYESGRILNAKAYSTSVQALGISMEQSAPPVSQTMGLITSVAGDGNSTPVLGMAQPVKGSTNPDGLTTYMQSLVQAGVLADLRFMILACPHSSSGSELILGGIDSRLEHVKPMVFDMLPKEGHYSIVPVSLGVANGNTPVGLFDQNTGIVVDSGGVGAFIPPVLFNSLVAALKKAVSEAHVSIPDTFWEHTPTTLNPQQMAALPAVTLNFKNGDVLSIPSSEYVVNGVFMFYHGATSSYSNFGDILFSSYAIEFNRSTESLSFYSNKGLCP